MKTTKAIIQIDTGRNRSMATIEEYRELHLRKDPILMNQVGMDKDQRESVHNECKWTASVLERIGDELEHNTLRITSENQHSLARIMRSAMNDCRKCKDC